MQIRAGLHDLDKVVECIKRVQKPIILLQGPVGAGKTTLVQAFAKSMGQTGVSSPTFSIQQVYGEDIYHYDLYNGGVDKFMELGLFEELQKKGWHFVEWGEELEDWLNRAGMEYLKVTIAPYGEKREYRCSY